MKTIFTLLPAIGFIGTCHSMSESKEGFDILPDAHLQRHGAAVESRATDTVITAYFDNQIQCIDCHTGWCS